MKKYDNTLFFVLISVIVFNSYCKCHSIAVLFILNRRIDAVSDRITVVIDTANVRKLRNIQAKMITTSPKSISFS